MLSDEQQHAISEICLGNQDAEQFCLVFVDWCHWIDDQIDQDRLWIPAATIWANFNMLSVFSSNPFYRTHRAELLAFIRAGVRAYIESLDWSKGGESIQRKRAADVMKSQYHETVWHVAYLVGGEEHARAMTKKWRAFDFEPENLDQSP